MRVAAGDINGDGITDLVAGIASGGGEVRAFDGADGTLLGTSRPFGAGFTGGVFVATGDVNADGHDDILLGAGAGSGLARLIDGATQTELGSGLPFPVAYTGGVTVAMGDVTGDGRADLIFGTAIGGFVRVFDGPTLTELASGFPYGPLFLGGVNVAAGDVNGDGIDEVALAPRNAGGPVRVYNLQAELVVEGTPFSGVQGVSLALADLNADGRDDLVMGAGAGAQPRVRAFSIVDRTQLLDLLAFDAGFTGGVNVATPSSSSTRFTSANSARGDRFAGLHTGRRRKRQRADHRYRHRRRRRRRPRHAGRQSHRDAHLHRPRQRRRRSTDARRDSRPDRDQRGRRAADDQPGGRLGRRRRNRDTRRDRRQRQSSADSESDGHLHVAQRDGLAQLHAGGQHVGQRGDHRDGV